MREFLTPEVWKQARHCENSRRKKPRWDLQPLVFILLLSVWSSGDSLAEKFEAARGFCISSRVCRRRPGGTLAGFQKAMAKLPLGVLRSLASGVRRRMLVLFGDRLYVDGFIPLGCDGSRVETPRSEELEHLPSSGKEHSAPCLWVTAIVHLRWGLLWSWRLGLGTASEQRHLIELLGTLPPMSLIITDAAYYCYELARAVSANSVFFLGRVYSRSTFYTLDEKPIDEFTEGIVYYWPEAARKSGKPPQKVRLIRVRANNKRDVWLATNVLDPQQLSIETAGKFYRWRWENEGLFRSYKRTLNNVKLHCRTVRGVHREFEGSLLATQLLLAQTTRALFANRRSPNKGAEPQLASPRKALLETRKEIAAAAPKPRRAFGQRLGSAVRERRERTSAKEKRVWPRRKPHKPPSPPKLRTLPEELKEQFQKHFQSTA